MDREVHEASVEILRNLARVAGLELNEGQLEPLVDEFRPLLAFARNLSQVKVSETVPAIVFQQLTQEE